MLALEQYEKIRREVEIKGKSQREVARELGHSRKTVAKALKHILPPGYQLSQPRCKPVIEPVRPILDEWIEQNKTARRKQRQTAMRMYERLCDEYDFKGSYGTVRRYVKETANRQQEVFMPLEFDPGQEAQVDWHEGWVYDNGIERKLQFFVMRQCYSVNLRVKTSQ